MYEIYDKCHIKECLPSLEINYGIPNPFFSVDVNTIFVGIYIVSIKHFPVTHKMKEIDKHLDIKFTPYRSASIWNNCYFSTSEMNSITQLYPLNNYVGLSKSCILAG